MLWRHGRTAWNDENRFQGTTDVPLDAIGIGQAERAARLVAAFPPDAVVSSDLERARQTAAPLLALTGIEAAYDEGLRETYGGRWQGLVTSQIEAMDPELWAAWRRGEDVPAGGGEMRHEVADRACTVVAKSLDSLGPERTLVVVTHGGTARSIIGRMLDLPSDRWGVLGGLANCAWSVLEEANTGWRLSEHNAGSLPEPVVGDDR